MFKKKIELKMRKPYSDDEAFIEKWNGSDPEDRHILVIDEFGNTGKSCYKETKFGYGVSDVDDVDNYMKIAQDNRIKYGNSEQKAKHSTMDERKLISMKIRDTKTKTSCVYIDKNKPMPEYMMSGKKPNRIYGVLNDTLEKTLPKHGVVWVVIDNNTQYVNDSRLKKECKSHSNKKRTVYGNQYSSEGRSITSNLLQTNDYVANAARSRTELNERERSRILKMRFMRINSSISGLKRRSVKGPGGRKAPSR